MNSNSYWREALHSQFYILFLRIHRFTVYFIALWFYCNIYVSFRRNFNFWNNTYLISQNRCFIFFTNQTIWQIWWKLFLHKISRCVSRFSVFVWIDGVCQNDTTDTLAKLLKLMKQNSWVLQFCLWLCYSVLHDPNSI